MSGMSLVRDSDRADKDALHILPLSIIPLKTPGLTRSRLVKNVRLEGMVELFTDDSAGSGQIPPSELRKIFKSADPEQEKDVEIIKKLSALSSYDVYSLRIELRNLGINVNNFADLRLSKEQSRELVMYMKDFTRPLIQAVYGDGGLDDINNFDDILGAFRNPKPGQARKNLVYLAKKLGIEIQYLPKFLEDYGDVYMSLAYYRNCLDNNMPKIASFLESLPEIRENRALSENTGLMQTCTMVEKKLRNTATQIYGIIDMFRIHTEDMWKDFSAERFRAMEKVIINYQTKIGGGLCAITVKMNAWSEAFPTPDQGGPYRRADFIMTHLRQGMDQIEEITYEDPEAAGPDQNPLFAMA